MKAQEQNLENRKTQLQTELNQGEAAKRDLDTAYQTLCQEVADEQQKLSDINSKKETANDDLQRLEHQKENLENFIDSLESRKKGLESEAQEMRRGGGPFSDRRGHPAAHVRNLRLAKDVIPGGNEEKNKGRKDGDRVDGMVRALKDEEQEKDRLIILLKEFHSDPALASMCHYKCTGTCVPAYVYQHTLRAGTDGPD
ncbi:hypothetical protein FOXYS1_13924 [Fusarium oxysporum]|uniref:Uncharacterized protein n=1 Tax=Fusarium oxysporum TaxID=5507 RepID=A0A8H4ZZD1_FUSOX|nr:hypothetical protein FOXYS1_13924 [Fusarium oxysporum]